MFETWRPLQTRQVDRRATPRTGEDAALAIELLRTVARNNRHSVFVLPLLASLIGLASLQWVGTGLVLAWFLAANLAIVLAFFVPARLLRAGRRAGDAARLTLICLGASIPLHLIWPSIVIFSWNSTNAVVNAYTVVFLCASLAGSVAVYATSVPLLAASVLCYLPYLALYSIGGEGYIAWLGPVTQVAFAALMLSIGLNVHRGAAMSIRQKVRNEILARKLVEANAQSEAARRRAEEASHAKSDFLAAMSHDLRTPLNAIMGFSDLILQGTYGPIAPARYAGYVRDIHDSGAHLLKLINDILDLSKIEAGKRELENVDVRLADVAEEVTHFVEPQALKADVRVRVDIPAAAVLRADERALVRILTNMLSNAVKFTKPGGTTTVFAKYLPEGGLAFGVEDTGVGIAPADMPTVLERFGQVKNGTTVEGQGTGLGLPIAKALIEAMDGTFRIESTPGVGTRVWGEFPASRVSLSRAIA